METILVYESKIRFGAFILIFFVMALWENFSPRRSSTYSRLIRWPNNLGTVLFNTVVIRLFFPTTIIGVTLACQEAGTGLFNFFYLPKWITIFCSVIILDLAIYLQHVLMHSISFLWRLHRMHHTDIDYDVTTGIRFHPIEIVISMFIKIMVVIVLGAPALSVLIFELLLNASSLFNHGNVRIHKSFDALIRLLIVTPDMHRVHHSVLSIETNSNYGFNLSLWDRLFGTYKYHPKDGHESMLIGLEIFRDSRELWIDRMLIQPFMGEVDQSALTNKAKKD